MQIQGQYAPAGTTWYNSVAAEEAVTIKSTAGLFFYIAVTNSNASARFVYVFNTTSPVGGDVIHPPIPVPAGGQVIVALPYAIPFTSALRIAASSSNATYTPSAGNDIRVSVLYK